MRPDVTARYSTEITEDNFSLLKNKLVKNEDFDEFSFEYINGRGYIYNTEDIYMDQEERCEEHIAKALKDTDVPAIFAVNIITENQDPFYGILSKDGYESFDIFDHLEKLAREKLKQAQTQQNTSAPTM